MEQQTISVFDRATNTFYPQGQDTLIDVVRFYIGVPCRGDLFDLIKKTVTGKIERKMISGGGLTDVFRPDKTTLKITSLETWKWTGKHWRQIS